VTVFAPRFTITNAIVAGLTGFCGEPTCLGLLA
jgi:hypothetical protein